MVKLASEWGQGGSKSTEDKLFTVISMITMYYIACGLERNGKKKRMKKWKGRKRRRKKAYNPITGD